LVASLYDKVTDYIAILGGFCGVIICFLMPGVLYIKTNGKPFVSFTNLSTAAIISALCIIGFTAGTITLVNKFTG
jgi:hypothetical protein